MWQVINIQLCLVNIILLFSLYCWILMNISLGNFRAVLSCTSLVKLAFYFISKEMQNDHFHLYWSSSVGALFSHWDLRESFGMFIKKRNIIWLCQSKCNQQRLFSHICRVRSCSSLQRWPWLVLPAESNPHLTLCPIPSQAFCRCGWWRTNPC